MTNVASRSMTNGPAGRALNASARAVARAARSAPSSPTSAIASITRHAVKYDATAPKSAG